ncbi:MAG: hypothetical protein AAGM67_04025, partial [Bacteroidota bacterium]
GFGFIPKDGAINPFNLHTDIISYTAMGNRLDSRKVYSKFVELESEEENTKAENLKTGDSLEWEGKDLDKNGQSKLFD